MATNFTLATDLLYALQSAIEAEEAHRNGLATARRNQEDFKRQLVDLIGEEALARLMRERADV